MNLRGAGYLLPFGVGFAAIVGCGGDSTSNGRLAATTAPGGAAATEQGGAAATEPHPGGTAATSDTPGGANACPATADSGQPISEFPRDVGCYVGINGLWHAVPCGCDLWVDSIFASELRAGFALSFTPANLGPSLDGDVDVEIEFPDVGGTWFDTWRQQAERTESFVVTHSSQEDTTTVRLGQNQVSLEPVPLAACESRRPHASVRGPWGTVLHLDMVATLTDRSGHTVQMINSDCEQPASHPTFHDDGAEAGAAGSPR